MHKVISTLSVVLIGLATSWYLFSLLRGPENGRDDHISRGRRWVARWSFTPDAIGGFSYWSLILVSVLGLFLELLMIRWVSCEIRIFAYFKNFVLISCFLGFGLGCYLCRRPINLLSTMIPMILVVLLIKVPIQTLRQVIDVYLSDYLGASSQVQIWGQPSMHLGLEGIAEMGAVTGVAVALFLLVSLMFVPIGQLLGWYLENSAQGILAYTINVLASLAGISVFTLLCFLEEGPIVWFGVAGLILTVLLWKLRTLRWTAIVCFALCAGLLSYQSKPNEKVYW